MVNILENLMRQKFSVAQKYLKVSGIDILKQDKDFKAESKTTGANIRMGTPQIGDAD